MKSTAMARSVWRAYQRKRGAALLADFDDMKPCEDMPGWMRLDFDRTDVVDAAYARAKRAIRRTLRAAA